MPRLLTSACLAGALLAGASAQAQIASVSWRTVDCGGGDSAGSGYALSGTIAQHDAGTLSGGGYEIIGGFWGGIAGAGGPAPCYANCDGSTLPPVLNVNDFNCFLTRFAAGDSYANCDGSTLPPILAVNDFNCFLLRFASGCP